MAAYKLTTRGVVIRAADGAEIPTSQIGGDYAEYQRWLDAGNTPDPADPPPVVYAGTGQVEAKVRTTDGTTTELYRRTLAPTTGYAADLTAIGVDAANGVLKTIRASVVAKRLNGGALLVGAPAVLATHQDSGAAATTSGVSGWTIAASMSGNDFVVTVQGAAGRTVDWQLFGVVRRFGPGGLQD